MPESKSANGEAIAVVGPTGAGKTALCKLWRPPLCRE